MKTSLRAITMTVLLAASLPAAAACNEESIAWDTGEPGRYVEHGNGSVTDTVTGLMWKKCSEGMTWAPGSESCDDTPSGYDWLGAHRRATAVNAVEEGENYGHQDWRLPNVKELASLVELACHDPAINESVFDDVTAGSYWSSSTSVDYAGAAWYVNFGGGSISAESKEVGTLFVRLVRDAE
ncbi:MAG: DUF1566 domain-containing protein [Chromatiales bacterium]|jgi:hypothetical protein|nr:DUF1566 domain-containing protein [Chromatiales bacterium]MDX9767880.1 DUF1566 domain-containing protein [Ectothiorhodospiraceae bacterium]